MPSTTGDVMPSVVKIPASTSSPVERLSIGDDPGDWQRAVGGYFAVLPIVEAADMLVVFAEEADRLGFQPNPRASNLMGRLLLGDVLLCGVEGEQMCDAPAGCETFL